MKAGRHRVLWLLLGLSLAAFGATIPYRAELRRQAEERHREQALVDAASPLTGATVQELEAEVARLEQEAGSGDGVSRWVRLSALYARLGRYPDALRCLRAAVEVDPHSLELRKSLADVYEVIGYYDRSLEELQAALSEHPENGELLLRLGRLYTTVGWHQEATPLLQRAVALMPRSVEAYRALGLAHYYRVNVAAALSALRQAAGLAPDDPRIPYEIARVQFEAGQIAACRTTAEATLARHPEVAGLHLLQGKVRMRSGSTADVAAARSAFERALQLAGSPEEQLEARYQLGLCALKQGDAKRAVSELEQVAGRTLEFQAVALKLGQLYLQSGRSDRGRRLLAAYEQIMRRGDLQKRLALRVAMRPTDADAHRALGEFLVRDVGDFRRGITELKRATDLRPGDAHLLGTLRSGLQRAGRGAEAAAITGG